MAITKMFSKIFGNKGDSKESQPDKNLSKKPPPSNETIKKYYRPILIFEDSPTWAGLMKKALESEGFEVFAYPNPTKAVDAVKKKRPQLILMDINMPEMSGYEATKLIKSKEENKPIPIVILTSQTDPQIKMNAMMAGARSLLSKDQPLEDLVIAVKAYMENQDLKTDITSIIENSKREKRP